ncbi:MAG: hypothetical protein ACRD18_02835, partial [Terriglobia bacterium]
MKDDLLISVLHLAGVPHGYGDGAGAGLALLPGTRATLSTKNVVDSGGYPQAIMKRNMRFWHSSGDLTLAARIRSAVG